MPRQSPLSFRLPLLALILALLAIEISFLPMPSIQEDEALFATPYLNSHLSLYTWTIGHVQVPVMLLTYIGTLKSWIYWPIFKLWGINAWSIRLPVCLLSLLTIWIFAEFLRWTTNETVALLTSLLLATDAPFVITNVFDWGPVCLLLLSTVLFLCFFQRFIAHGNRSWLCAAFFVAGMASWYKALFLVLVAAVALSCLIVFGLRCREWIQVRNVSVAILSFTIGAAPLIIFNLTRKGPTFTASRDLPAVGAGEKLMMLRHTLDGRALEHYMFRSIPGERIQLIGAPLEKLVTQWYSQTSFHPASLLLPALILALLALPFLRSSPLFRPILFCWIAFAAMETAMVLFRDAGAGPHHTLLLYPAPQFIAAATAWAIGDKMHRPLAAWSVAVVLVSANLWLLHSYYERGKENGFSAYWTDGAENLARVVAGQYLPVAILDWGIQSGLQVETHGQIPIVAPEPIRPGVLYVGHCAGFVIDESRSVRYQQLLREERRVTDRHGAPLYCLYEMQDRP